MFNPNRKFIFGQRFQFPARQRLGSIDSQAAADGNRHIPVVACQDPYSDMQPAQLFYGCGGAAFGSVEKCQIAQQNETLLIFRGHAV